LIAEDEVANFKILETLLKRRGALILRAENGLEAIEQVKRDPDIRVVLMDLKMPVMDGATATKIIKDMKRTLPIIAQTAYALIEERIEYEKVGFDNYLVKPINENELLEAIRKVLR
jgi:CheY-like chemotaxis protein